MIYGLPGLLPQILPASLSILLASQTLTVQRPISLAEIIAHLPEGVRVFLYYLMNGKLVFFASLTIFSVVATVVAVVKIVQILRELSAAPVQPAGVAASHRHPVARFWFGNLVNAEALTPERRRELVWKLFTAIAAITLLIALVVLFAIDF